MSTELESVTKTIVETFSNFNIEMEVTQSYEGFNYHHVHLVPKKPVRMHEVRGFEDDLRFALGKYVVKIEAPVKHKKEIAIRVIKENRGEPVHWADLNQSDYPTPLTVPLGITEQGERITIDIATLPHLLIGGQNLSGKSNFIHGVLNSLVLRHTPESLRLILVDPKKNGLHLYKGLPHLMTEPISSTEKTVMALKWACKEVERRFDILESAELTTIGEYHKAVSPAERKNEPMPYIIIAIDEMADVMSEYGDETAKLLTSLAVFGRGVGVHMMLSTASHEPRIIRGGLRAHISSAICFAGPKETSEAFIYQEGADDLIGQGVALFTGPDTWPAIEVRTGIISDKEVKNNVLKVKKRHGAVDENNLDLKTLVDYRLTLFAFDDEEDELYEDARKAVIEAGKASTSYLQRKLRIGYSRAARLMDLLEERGVIGPQDGSSPREVLE
jgi:S-DNA-T family DNA segregation ATPase FtsK/SpoIIIE